MLLLAKTRRRREKTKRGERKCVLMLVCEGRKGSREEKRRRKRGNETAGVERERSQRLCLCVCDGGEALREMQVRENVARERETLCMSEAGARQWLNL